MAARSRLRHSLLPAAQGRTDHRETWFSDLPARAFRPALPTAHGLGLLVGCYHVQHRSPTRSLSPFPLSLAIDPNRFRAMKPDFPARWTVRGLGNPLGGHL